MAILAILLLLIINISPVMADSQIKQVAKGVKPEVLNLALKAYNNTKKLGLVKNEHLTIIDYSLPSNQRRKWVIDMKNKQLAYHLHVSHGKNSGLARSTTFSNKSGSLASSLGTFVTRETYQSGKVGFALRLDGLDKGHNNNALSRGVVIHGAKYANPEFLKQHNRMGRSWGCPAVKQSVNKPLINKIKNGSVVFVYGDDKSWLNSPSAMHRV